MAVMQQSLQPAPVREHPPAPVPPGGLRHRAGVAWRSFLAGAWLGWQNESNWADPWLFLIYTVIRPLSTALILLVMYLVVARQDTRTPLFAYLYLGNAFFQYVFFVILGTAWAVIEDREFFRMLKFVTLSPIRYLWYVVGRATTRTAMATVSVGLLLAFGIGFLGIPLRWDAIRWSVLLPGFAVGLVACMSAGVALAGFILVTIRKGPSAIEAVPGVLYVLAGVVFPIDLLPGWVQPLARWLPFTYWLEAIRRGLVGGGLNRALAGLPDGDVLMRLAAGALVLLAVTLFWFRYCERVVRDRGLVDQPTEW